jgi:predicted membrane-bound spermidine synthase
MVGFTELGLEILLLLGFQALYGYVYHELTILVALFMMGVALGSALALRSSTLLNRVGMKRNLRLLALLQIVLAASPLLLYGLFVHLGHVNSANGQRVASEILFPALALVAGLLGGFQFLLASRVYFGNASDNGHSPGVLYSLDLAGACAGALALGAWLIPIYGFLRTAALMASLNLLPAVMVAAAGWVRLAGQPGRREVTRNCGE